MLYVDKASILSQ